jgi:polyketide synthase 12/polyene macrolide polyketide synthase/epothilone polyketide synthase D
MPGPRRAGVSSFGFSGTNAHVILEQAPPPPRPDIAAPEDQWHLLTISARNEPACRELAARYAARLEETPIR